MKKLFFMCLLLTASLAAQAQRVTDKLDRGLVAVPSGSGSFVSWRIFGEEYYDTEYNLYRNGQLLNDKPLKVSNFTDTGGRSGSKYQVAAVVRGVEQERSAEVKRLNQQYIEFAVGKLYSRRGTDITGDYNINDIALADVNGDGVSEFIMKRNYGPDGSSVANDSAYNCIECYTLSGERLWWIDLGPNMVSGPDEQYDAVGYDWDGDGKAEILMRGADNMIIHHADGTTTNIGNMSVNTRNTVLQTANMTYTNTGNEYLLYLEGATGKPYSIGSGTTPLWMTYPLPRGDANDWGDGYGHRSTKHYFGAPFLDGRKTYIFLGRGCYTKHHMKAFSVNPATHKLTQYWEWKGEQWPYHGQGYHNFGIADVDWDGRDEIVFGSMVIDDNGKGLHTTGLGHGDAQHCSDFDPYRHGQEIFACNEDSPAMNYRNATTGKIYYRLQSTGDDGRALCGNFSNDYPGAIGHSSQSGTISCVADKVISGGPGGFTNNWRIYWDGDLLEEGLDGANSREGAARVFKADGSVVFTADGTANCNWTKNTPSAAGDILGDWREEIIVRTSDNKYVRVYTTDKATQWRNYTLWHDHQYRQGMVWESMGYNQPPHASYFLGELENITIAPPPLTMTGRTEVTNGGTIGSEHNDQHVIVCETKNTSITIAEGAQPYMLTFNVPSWVQGTNSTKTDGTGSIKYTYYTCNVTGAALTGSMRLVKQGDGILSLPKTDNTYTGETNVWAGTLNFDGTLKNSPLWLNRFAELNSDGGQFKTIQMEYDAKLRPGRADNCGTITTDSLRLGFGSRIIFDIYNDLSADQVNMKVLTIETKSWKCGPEYQAPVFEFVSHKSAQELTAAGEYLIGRAEEIVGDLNKIRIEGIDNKLKAQLTSRDGNIYLYIAGLRDNHEIVWRGTESDIWDLGLTENFISADDQTVSDIFVTGDDVRFDDEASMFNVKINSDIEADTITVDNTKAYSFSGTGAITGKTTLVKKGSGTLTINNENTFIGGVRISGGAISIGSLSNENQAKGNLGGVRSSAAQFVIENKAVLRATAAVTQGSPMKMESEDGGTINHSADFIVNKPISGTKLTKAGAGWMKFNVANSGLSRLVIGAGTVQCINCNVPAKTVEFSNGTLRENTGTSYTIEVPKGKSGSWYMANRSTYTNKLTGEGKITIYCVTEKGTNYYATRTPIQCNFTDFEGTIVPTSSLDDPAVLRFTLNMTGGMPKGTMDIPENVQVQNSGRTYRIGRVLGKGALGGSCTFSNGGSVGANTWEVGYENNSTMNAKVTSNANFVKVGSGKISLYGACDHTGSTTISEGELCLMSGGTLGSGTLTVNSGALLSGYNPSAQLNNSSVNILGRLRPGAQESSTVGYLNFGGKNLTIAASGVVQFRAKQCATEKADGTTSLLNINRLTVNGTINVIIDESSTLTAGDSIRLWKNVTTFAGTPQFDLPKDYTWDTSRISEGLLFIADVPTSIDAISRSKEHSDNIYDLTGRLVRRNAQTTEGLPSGLYIRGGRKIIIK